MSTANYKYNPRQSYIVRCTFEVNGETKTYNRFCYAFTEEAALEEAKQNVLVSRYPSFSMEIVESRII